MNDNSLSLRGDPSLAIKSEHISLKFIPCREESESQDCAREREEYEFFNQGTLIIYMEENQIDLINDRYD